MKCQLKLIAADGREEKKVIRRRFVPISFEVNRRGQHVTFEKKLPFKTAKVVGLMTVVSQRLKPIPDGCPPGVECPDEPIIVPVPIGGEFGD